MRFTTLLLFLALAASCSHSATGPKTVGHDPSVLITNNSPSATVIFRWLTPSTVTGLDTVFFFPNGTPSTIAVGGVIVDTVRPLTTTCSRFTTSADSASWDVLAYDSTTSPPSYATSSYYPNWFAPQTDSSWFATVTQTAVAVGPGSPC
jgi:hypothetical protein